MEKPKSKTRIIINMLISLLLVFISGGMLLDLHEQKQSPAWAWILLTVLHLYVSHYFLGEGLTKLKKLFK